MLTIYRDVKKFSARVLAESEPRAQQRISILVPLLRHYRVPEFLFYPVPPIYFRGAHTREREREEEFARVLMNLYESPPDVTFFFLFARALKTPYTENIGKLCALSERNPYLYSENPFSRL